MMNPACVYVMKQPSSEEWHIAVDPWFIVDVLLCREPLLEEVVNNLLFKLMRDTFKWHNIVYLWNTSVKLCKIDP
jgi:hypothetical protein